MAINVIIGPAAEPLTLAQAKQHLRVIGTDEDDYITSLLKAARQTVELKTSRVLVSQTLRQTFDAFPCDSSRQNCIELKRQPVQSIVSVDYLNGDGVTTAWPTDQRQAIYAEPARLRPAYGFSWPTTRKEPDAVAVTYVAGYGGPADVPELVKAAIRLLMGHWYENREEVVTGTITAELPRGAKSIMEMLSWGHYE